MRRLLSDLITSSTASYWRQQAGSAKRQRIPPLRPGLIPIEAQGLHDRRVAEAEQEGRAVATIDVLAEGPGRHREHVLVVPVEPLVAHQRVAGAFDHMIVRAASATARPSLVHCA